MDEVNNMLKKEYYDFRNSLIRSIHNKDKNLFTQNSEDCYLIEESWNNELLKYFYNSKDNFLPKNFPIFINNLNDIIEHLKNEKKLKLINKKFIDLLYQNENNLKNIPIIQYYGGNNKLIVEYKNKRANKALLLLEPLNQNSIINRIFILSINNKDKLFLYNDLLSEENNSNIESKQKYKKFVISLNNKPFLPKPSQTPNDLNQNNTNQNNTEEIFKKDIIKILIYIFYYQKYLKDEKEKVIKENNSYCLMNKEWLHKFLEYYDYKKIYNSLINMSKQNPKINYINLNKFINSYVDNLYKKNLINFEKETIEDFSDIQKIFEKKNQINNNFSFNNCYIISYSIIFLINKYIIQNDSWKNYLKKIYTKRNDIFFYDFNSIIIGNLNEELFIPKYILYYDSKEILNSEKEVFASNDIENYFKMRNCNINNNTTQNLINNNKIIGKLITIIEKNILPVNKDLMFNSKTVIMKTLQNKINNNLSIGKIKINNFTKNYNSQNKSDKKINIDCKQNNNLI